MLKIIKRFSITSALSISLIISPTFAAGDHNTQMQEMQQLQLKMQRDMETIRTDQMRIQQERAQLEKDRMELMKLRQSMMNERNVGTTQGQTPTQTKQPAQQ